MTWTCVIIFFLENIGCKNHNSHTELDKGGDTLRCLLEAVYNFTDESEGDDSTRVVAVLLLY